MGKINAEMRVHRHDKAGTVDAFCQTGAAPFVRGSDKSAGIGDNLLPFTFRGIIVLSAVGVHDSAFVDPELFPGDILAFFLQHTGPVEVVDLSPYLLKTLYSKSVFHKVVGLSVNGFP